MTITKRPWGAIGNAPVWLFDIQLSDGIRVSVSNYGGVIQSIFVPDKNGNPLDVALGYDTLEEYLRSETYFGAMVGPVADRIEGGQCTLDGRKIQFPLNAGPDMTHSGAGGFHCQIWDWELLEDGISLHRTFEEADNGFPGPLQMRVNYRITAPDTLRLEYIAKSEKETALSVTNHSYFNLDGGKNHCREHLISINASHYAETCREADPVATGRILPITGTPFDLRAETPLGEILRHTDFSELRTADGLDHFFPVDGEGFRRHAALHSPASGLTLTCTSDAPGVFVYAANGLEAEPGKAGAVYGRNWAVCLETECFPNGVNLPRWRDQVILPAGEERRTVTEFTFSRK